MLRLDINLLFNLINIIILYIGCRMFLFKPVNRIIEKRREETERGYAEAEEAKAEAEKIRAEQDQIIAAANEESERILEQARNRANEEYERRMEMADKDAQLTAAKAKAEIAEEKKRALKDMEGQIISLVMAATEKVVEKKADSEQDLLLYDRFLAEVGEQSGTEVH